MNALDKIYGMIMYVDRMQSIQLFEAVKEEWNLFEIHKDLHDVIRELISSGEEINILTCTQGLKASGKLKKDYVGKLSAMTASIGVYELMNPYYFYNCADEEYTNRRAVKLTQEITAANSNGVLTIDKYRTLLEEALKGVADQIVKRETNIETMFNVIQRHNDAKNGNLSGIKLPYRSLLKTILLESVDLMVVGARPAMGKTAWVVSTAVAIAMQTELRVAIFALEMSRVQMMRRILANIAQVDSNKIKYGECSDDEMRRLYAVQELSEMDNIMIFEGSHTVGDIASEVTRMKSGKGVDLIFVDYLQKIKPEKGIKDLTQAVTYASNGLKSISQNMHVPIIAMAQLSRDSAKSGKRPSLPDLRQSGEIEQDASIVGFIHRPEYYGEAFMEDGFTDSTDMAEFIVAKNREGGIGIFNFTVNLKISKFTEPTYHSVPGSGVQTKDPDDDIPF